MTTRPAYLPFRLYTHATFSEQTVLRDADGVPLDLTGYSARMHIRRERQDLLPLFDLSSDAGDIELGGVEGTLVFRIDADATAGAVLLDPDGEGWVYDLLLTDTSVPPNVDRVFQGVIFVSPGVTRVQ